MFAKNIKFLRKKRNWTQKDVSDRIGYKSSAAVNKWEVGGNMPHYNVIEHLADLFGVTVFDLMNTDIEKQELEMINGLDNVSLPAAHAVPILGTICAGDGTECIETYDGAFFVDNSIKADLCVTVKGNSMIDAGIYDKDKAFVKRNCSYDNGKIYAVRMNDQNDAVLKKVYWQDKQIILCPCNDSYDPIVTDEDDISIIGECVGIYHVV